MKLKKQVAALVAAGLVSLAGGAQAAIIVNDWQIDLGALGATAGGNFTGFGVFGPPTGITQLSFDALFHGVAAGPIAPGTLQTVDVLGKVTAATGSAGIFTNTTTNALLNVNVPGINGFELTFGSTTTLQLLSVNPGTGQVLNSHLGAGAGPNGVEANGILNIYADVLGDAIGVAGNTSAITGGAGFQDGLLIASFQIVNQFPLATGSFNTQTLDGQDDALFTLIANPFGILQDSAGNALAIDTTLAFTDSNTDADPDNNGILDTAPTAFPATLGPCLPSGLQSPGNTCGNENGSFSIAVPEPGTLALLGISMLGLGGFRRSRS
jgi:hypothetical protein